MRVKAILASLLIVLGCLNLSGCGHPATTNPDFTGLEAIAELSTLKCYYHNVAEIKNDGTNYLFGIVNVGYKKAWYEYRGCVVLGIDMNKVEISSPDSDNVVKVELPPVEVFATPVDVDSIKLVSIDGGVFQKITNEEQAEAYKNAQEEMKERALNDAQLHKEAEKHARVLIEEYIENVGESVGQTYTVKFVERKQD